MANQENLCSLTVGIEFHYKSAGSARPNDENECTDTLVWENGLIPLPAVEDTVTYNSYEWEDASANKGRNIIRFRKIVTRHFNVNEGHIGVYFVVSDVAKEDIDARLKV